MRIPLWGSRNNWEVVTMNRFTRSLDQFRFELNKMEGMEWVSWFVLKPLVVVLAIATFVASNMGVI